MWGEKGEFCSQDLRRDTICSVPHRAPNAIYIIKSSNLPRDLQVNNVPVLGRSWAMPRRAGVAYDSAIARTVVA
ncbi:MAG: hypothetical protein F6J93_09400 [Oscillatoria sp. SIO1A7]|nr:hypothetical protein [Oscillatoria sp. SIO1A7]